MNPFRNEPDQNRILDEFILDHKVRVCGRTYFFFFFLWRTGRVLKLRNSLRLTVKDLSELSSI